MSHRHGGGLDDGTTTGGDHRSARLDWHPAIASAALGLGVSAAGGTLLIAGIALDQRANDPAPLLVDALQGAGVLVILLGLAVAVAHYRTRPAAPHDATAATKAAERRNATQAVAREAARKRAQFKLQIIDEARSTVRDIIRRVDEPIVGRDDQWTGFLVDHFLREKSRLGSNMRMNNVAVGSAWFNPEPTKSQIEGMMKSEFRDYLVELQRLVDDARSVVLAEMGRPQP